MDTGLNTDDAVGAADENPPVYTPNAPIEQNARNDNGIAYDDNGNAQFATLDANDLAAVDQDDNAATNNNDNDDNSNEEEDAPAADNAAAAAAVGIGLGVGVDNNGESFKNNGNGGNRNQVYNGNNGIGEGLNVNNGPVNRLPPWFESTGNQAVDYKLARSRCCCCSLRAGMETLGASVILIAIWDLLISSQFAEEQVIVNVLSLFRILGGICGFVGAWKYHKNASLMFIIFWIIDMIFTFCLLSWSIYLISNCNNEYDDDDEDWGWWYADCKYKYENLTGMYCIVFLSEIYFAIVSRRFYKLIKEI